MEGQLKYFLIHNAFVLFSAWMSGLIFKTFAVHAKVAPMLLWRWKSQAGPSAPIPSSFKNTKGALFKCCSLIHPFLEKVYISMRKRWSGRVCMVNVYTSCTSGKPFMPGRRCLRSLYKKQSHDKRSPRCPDCVASAKPLPWREMFQIRSFNVLAEIVWYQSQYH